MRRRLLIAANSKKLPYLMVIPEEVTWVTVGFPIEYSVFSNKKWTIE